METVLVFLAVTGFVTAFLFALFSFTRRLFGILPKGINSVKTNAHVLWLLLTIGILSFWLSSIDGLRAAEKWSIPFWKNLMWVCVLPYVLYLVRRPFTAMPGTSILTGSSTGPNQGREPDGERGVGHPDCS